MLVQDSLGVFLALAARWEQRMMKGGGASEVAALLPFLLLYRQKKKVEAIDKTFIDSHMWERQQAEEFMSQLTPTYIYRPLKSVRANAWIT